MIRMRTAGLVLTLMTVAASVLAPAAFASDKPFAVIDTQRIVDEYTAAKDAHEQYRRFIQEKEQEIADKERDLQIMLEEIESQRMLLGEDALRVKVEEFDSQRSEYYDMRMRLESEADTEYKAKIQPIVDQIKLIAERIGTEEGFGIIIDATALTVIYLDPDNDLTDRVISALVRGVEE